MLIFSNLEIWAKSQPQKTSIIYYDKKISYEELYIQVKTAAHCLSSSIKKREKILIKRANPIDQLTLLLGASIAGIASVLLDSNIPKIYLNHIKELVNPFQIIDGNFHLSKDSLNNLPLVTENDIFLGALSSGSTSLPKLIWRDHKSWVKAFPFQSRIFNLGSKDTLYLAGSLCFTANLNSCLHILYEGGTVVFSKNSYPRTWIYELDRYDISSIFMVPANYQILINNSIAPMPKVKSIVSAGAQLSNTTLLGLNSLFPKAQICEYYGASEVGHISYSYFDDMIKYPDSVGKPFPNVEIEIEDELIWVSSPYIAPDFAPKAAVGDIGKINNEGYLFLYGRKNNIINCGGVKIIPEQIEKIINSCPGVSQCIVKGVKDPVRGEKIKAWVGKKHSEITSKDIRTFCKKYIPEKFCPHIIEFIDEFPLNSNGKIDRNIL